YVSMIYLHYKDTKTFGHSFSFLLIFKTLRASYLQVGNFSNTILSHPPLPASALIPVRSAKLCGALTHEALTAPSKIHANPEKQDFVWWDALIQLTLQRR
ncbi:MAG: hypothetical protein SPL43_00290, partial [Prevotella sp.]|nr:hypothetical protein [Prevotella sp.]